ncbi:MAG: DUF3467 domain-containing protein [Candidatus Kerfeldbacteria bacterium]|nr:DUF3467 domain-containing protein [Candidatus Kerfeldbacteria bacterium]
MSPQQIHIKAHDNVLQGVYANVLQISHTKEEVVFDFLNVMPPQGQLVSRVITSPGHAKRILTALADNLKRYEAQFGAVTAAKPPAGEFGFTPTG